MATTTANNGNSATPTANNGNSATPTANNNNNNNNINLTIGDHDEDFPDIQVLMRQSMSTLYRSRTNVANRGKELLLEGRALRRQAVALYDKLKRALRSSVELSVDSLQLFNSIIRRLRLLRDEKHQQDHKIQEILRRELGQLVPLMNSLPQGSSSSSGGAPPSGGGGGGGGDDDDDDDSSNGGGAPSPGGNSGNTNGRGAPSGSGSNHSTTTSGGAPSNTGNSSTAGGAPSNNGNSSTAGGAPSGRGPVRNWRSAYEYEDGDDFFPCGLDPALEAQLYGRLINSNNSSKNSKNSKNNNNNSSKKQQLKQQQKIPTEAEVLLMSDKEISALLPTVPAALMSTEAQVALCRKLATELILRRGQPPQAGDSLIHKCSEHFCLYASSDRSNLRRHLQQQHFEPAVAQTSRCPICPFTVSSLQFKLFLLL